MTTIILAMVAGIIVGCLDLLNYHRQQQLDLLAKIALALMLFCLAAKITCDASLLSQFSTIWHRSVFLTIAVLSCSFLAVVLVKRFFKHTLEKLLQEDQDI